MAVVNISREFLIGGKKVFINAWEFEPGWRIGLNVPIYTDNSSYNKFRKDHATKISEAIFEVEQEIGLENVYDYTASISQGGIRPEKNPTFKSGGKDKMKSYAITGVGGSPKNVLRKMQEAGHIPNHITDIQLVALPHGTDAHKYIEIIKNQFAANTAGAFIMHLGDDTVQIPREEMTGKCSRNETVFKGQRKWETLYAVYTDVVTKAIDPATGGEIISIDPLEIGTFAMKNDAVEEAKKYAIDNDTKTYIKLEKRLDSNSGTQLLAEYEPLKRTVYDKKVIPKNEYLFFGMYDESAVAEEPVKGGDELAYGKI